LKIDFVKYHGAGNDFVIIDCLREEYKALHLSLSQIKKICDRHFGVGADGLMLLKEDADTDFLMDYYNSDGRRSSMCGNGARCIVDYAQKCGYAEEKVVFIAPDGLHEASKEGDLINLKMGDVKSVELTEKNHYFLDTGSPHYVVFEEDIEHLDLIKEAHQIRYNNRFAKDGTNVNMVELDGSKLKLRTYERGVENETLACGTGVVASVLALAEKSKIQTKGTQEVSARGGELSVSYERGSEGYHNIWLKGPTKEVFTGSLDLDLLT